MPRYTCIEEVHPVVTRHSGDCIKAVTSYRRTGSSAELDVRALTRYQLISARGGPSYADSKCVPQLHVETSQQGRCEPPRAVA
jgi:hypothetical protein